MAVVGNSAGLVRRSRSEDSQMSSCSGRSWKRVGRITWMASCVLGMLACQGTDVSPPTPPSINELFWGLRASHHAVTLAAAPPYDTLTITATPRNAAGEPLQGLPTPIYTSTDNRSVQISPDGKLQALAPTS